MLKSLFHKFLKKNKEEIEVEEVSENKLTLEIINNADLSSVPDAKIGTTNPYFAYENKDENRETVLIVDDQINISYIYERCFKLIKSKCNHNVYQDFNMVNVIDANCGIIAFKYLKEHKIDKAILDITLGYLLELDGKFVTIDGIDLAAEIWKRYPEASIIFSTVHTANKRNYAMNIYFEKFNELTGRDLTDYYVNKSDDDLFKKLCKLLYGEEACDIIA